MDGHGFLTGGQAVISYRVSAYQQKRDEEAMRKRQSVGVCVESSCEPNRHERRKAASVARKAGK